MPKLPYDQSQPFELISTRGRINPEQVPPSLVHRLQRDPAVAGGGPPLHGREWLPHITSVAGRYGAASQSYPIADQAYRENFHHASIMRNDTAITEPLEARQRGVALLNWSIEPLIEKKCERSKALAEKLTKILQLTGFGGQGSNFYRLRYALMDALWYGRHATIQNFDTAELEGKYVSYIKNWSPRNGDKLVFRYDEGSGRHDPDQVGIRIGTGFDEDALFTDYAGNTRRKIEPTQYGLVYWLDGNERRTMAIHRHIIEDSDFFEPINAGMIHGIGIRHRIYYTWYMYQECLRLMLEYVERSALGVEVWHYPAHNKEAKERTEQAAMDRGSPGRNVLLVPVPEGEYSDLYRVEFMEPGTQGLAFLLELNDKYFGHKIKRYILGQTLSSEAEATGMGSGVADAHMATYADIVKADAINLEETLTNEIVRPLQLHNYPGTSGIYLQFKINTEADESEKKLEAMRSAYDMGAKIKTEDVMDIIGTSIPNEDEEYLQNPQLANGGMMGMLGGMGQPNTTSTFAGGMGFDQQQPQSQPQNQQQESGESVNQYGHETERYTQENFAAAFEQVITERFGKKTKPNKGQGEFEWITIGGHEEGDKKHAGGTPVQIRKSDGQIVKGPDELIGADLDDLDKDKEGTKKDKRKQNAPPKSGSIEKPNRAMDLFEKHGREMIADLAKLGDDHNELYEKFKKKVQESPDKTLRLLEKYEKSKGQKQASKPKEKSDFQKAKESKPTTAKERRLQKEELMNAIVNKSHEKYVDPAKSRTMEHHLERVGQATGKNLKTKPTDNNDAQLYHRAKSAFLKHGIEKDEKENAVSLSDHRKQITHLSQMAKNYEKASSKSSRDKAITEVRNALAEVSKARVKGMKVADNKIKETAIESARAAIKAHQEYTPKGKDHNGNEFAPGVHASIIPKQAGYDAHRNTSFSPEKRAKQRQEDFVAEMNQAYHELKASAKGDESKLAVLEKEWPRMLERARSNYLAALSADSRTASAMITGPAKFPSQGNQKRMDSAMNRWREYSEHVKKAQKAITKKMHPENAPKKIGDKGTGNHLETKIQQLQELQDHMKSVNAVIRKHVDMKATGNNYDASDNYRFKGVVFKKGKSRETAMEALLEMGLSESDASELITSKQARGVGYPSYRLSNNNANLKRYKTQLERQKSHESEAAKVRESTGGGTETHQFDGGSVTYDYEDNRIRIKHDKKPERTVINELKASGFRWSRKNGAWQRQLTDNAKRAAKPSRDTPRINPPNNNPTHPLHRS